MNLNTFLRCHLAHVLYFVNSQGNAPMPQLIELEISNKCNLRCKMCWWDFDKKKADNELAFEEVKNLVEQIRLFKPNVTLTGAEPFIRKDTAKILRYMADRQVSVNAILTNGVLVDEKDSQTIVETGVRLVQVSIDGDKDTHERIRGVQGCYDKALRGIKFIQSAMEGQNKKNPDIRINCVISSENLHCLESLVDLAEELHVKLQYQHLMWLDKQHIDLHKKFLRKRLLFEDNTIQNLENNLQDLDLKLLEEKIRKIRKACQKRKVPLNFLQFSDQEMIRNWYSDLNFIPRNKCIGPFLVAKISAEGDVKFCPFIDFTIGNVKDRPFKSLWNNSRAKKVRSLLKRERLFPGCVRCCKL